MAETLTSAAFREIGGGDEAGTTQSLTLVVEGMHCGNCMRKVERTLVPWKGRM